MSLKADIVSFAYAQGASLVGVAGVETCSDYLEQVRARLLETGATGADYMLAEDALPFFERLSDARRTLPSARSIMLLGVYSFDSMGARHIV